MLSEDPNDFCWFDTETRAHSYGNKYDGDVTKCGAYRYAKSSRPIILTYCIGKGPVQVVARDRWEGRDGGLLTRADLPPEFQQFHERARAGKAWFVAWNAAFDRLQMNTPTTYMPVETTLDAMAQAVASQLPASLGGASRALGRSGKIDQGKELIRIFSPFDGGTPQTHPEDWELFKEYARVDTEELREVWLSTRPLSLTEWQDYWVNERINDRGMAVDLPFVTAAAALAESSREYTNRKLSAITEGAIEKVTMIQRLTDWTWDNTTMSGVRAAMIKAYYEDDEADEVEVKIGLDRNKIETILALLDRTDQEHGLTDIDWAIMQALELRMWGGSASPFKFQKMLQQADEGRLKGQYVFNGAPQTGRYSSRGVQVHNLTRSTLGAELEAEAIEEIANLPLGDAGYSERTMDALEEQFDTPISRALSLLVRPAFVAAEGNTLLWGDWSAIEARVLPWLADTKRSRKVLEIFEGNDKDPGKPDIYMIESCNLTGADPQEMWDRYRDKDPEAKNARQGGKVSVLSLGFGGSVGALKNMATNYGIHYSDAEARYVVDAWRENNPWARTYWDQLREAFESCMLDPEMIYTAGKVSYIYDRNYMSGTVFCALPEGIIAYPRVNERTVKITNPATGEEEERTGLYYKRGFGWSGIWYGKLAENITQGTAASLLRHTLRALDPDDVVVGHTHDEVITEVALKLAEEYAKKLRGTMEKNPPWMRGCPLVAAVTENWYYTKAID